MMLLESGAHAYSFENIASSGSRLIITSAVTVPSKQPLSPVKHGLSGINGDPITQAQTSLPTTCLWRITN